MSNTQEIVREVETFYRAYLDAFNRQDADGYARFMDLPYALISGEGGVVVCATEPDHQRLAAQLYADLKARGWARSDADRVRISLFGQNHALIVSDIIRWRADGSVLQKNRFCYTARHDGNSWKMITYLPVADGFLGPGNFPR
ncbi:MAG TPA: hypothetical protein VMM16_13310 [Verrucomicrobiae bacterium]|nr:hypothetical protein [Verrucomicrobiae bacterium]